MNRFLSKALKATAFVALATVSLSADKPNILVFLVDDLGAHDLSYAGSDFYESPAINSLAETGTVYTQAYAAHPRCVPSRYAFFSGRNPARDGCPGNRYNLATERLTVAEALKAGGYTTFFTGKWHLSKKEEEMPAAQGFDISVGGGVAGAPRAFFAPYNKLRTPHHKADPIPDFDDAPDGESLTERLTDETVKFLKSHISESDAPFFAVLSHYSVHTPLEAKAKDIAYFEEKLGRRGKEKFEDRDGNTKLEQDNPTYAAMIRSVDDSLAKVLKTLDELGVSKNTLVIFTSDHGGLSNRGFGSKRKLATTNLPLRAGKGHLYEGGIRVPFIVKWPERAPANATRDAVIVGTDLFATLMDVAAIDYDKSDILDSVSFLPTLADSSRFERPPVIFHSPRPRPKSTGDTAASAIRDGRYKLLQFYFPEPYVEIYDIQTDPEEQIDLSKEKPEIAQSLQRALKQSLKEMDALKPKPCK